MNGVSEDKPLLVPRDIELRLDTTPITALDALGEPHDTPGDPPEVSPRR